MYAGPMSDKIPPALLSVDQAAQAVRERSPLVPQVGLVLGSGLGRLAGRLEGLVDIPCEEIPNLPRPAVAGHGGSLSLGTLSSVPVACLRGRVHLYEGHSPERVVFGVRLLACLGCKVVILTNAAGATTSLDKPGGALLIADHLNLTGHNPLVGFRSPAQFIDLSDLYTKRIRAIALQVAKDLGLVLREGVYAGLVGPSYETKAEVAYLSRIGADAVGMSTVLEAIALADMKVEVLGLSCLTNYAAGVENAILDHAHVQATANLGADNLERLILGVISRLFVPA